MANTLVEKPPLRFRDIGRYVAAGGVAGIAAAVLNNVVYSILVAAGGLHWEGLVALSVTLASLMPNLLGGILYFALSRFTRKARLIFSAAVTAFVLVSILPHLGIGPAPSPALQILPEGFDLMTIPLHVIFGLAAATITPLWASRSPHQMPGSSR